MAFLHCDMKKGKVKIIAVDKSDIQHPTYLNLYTDIHRGRVINAVSIKYTQDISVISFQLNSLVRSFLDEMDNT